MLVCLIGRRELRLPGFVVVVGLVVEISGRLVSFVVVGRRQLRFDRSEVR